MRAVAALAVLAVGCGPSVMWTGRTADRRHRIEVVERGGLSYVIVDGEQRAAYRGVAGWSVALAGKHISFAARLDERWAVVTDGRVGRRWDEVGGIELTDEGTPIYIASKDGGWHVVTGESVGPRFDAILAGSLRIANGHVAYAGRSGDKVRVVDDGVLHPAFDGVGQLQLSADGTRTLYAARRGDVAYVVADGVVGDEWGAVTKLAFGPGSHVAYAASEGRGWRLVVDGVPGPTVDSIGRFEFRDDGSHVAWTAKLDGIDVLCVDDHPLATVGPRARFAFRPGSGDTLGLAYVAGTHVVVDDQPQPDYDEVGALAWSRAGTLAYTARRGQRWSVVVDGRETASADRIGDLVFSDDGARLGFVAARGKTTEVVVDGRAHPFDLAFDDSLVFSQDGAHWAVIAGDVAREQLFIAIDGTQRVVLPARDIASSSTAHDPDVLRAWTRAELARYARP